MNTMYEKIRGNVLMCLQNYAVPTIHTYFEDTITGPGGQEKGMTVVGEMATVDLLCVLIIAVHLLPGHRIPNLKRIENKIYNYPFFSHKTKKMLHGCHPSCVPDFPTRT